MVYDCLFELRNAPMKCLKDRFSCQIHGHFNNKEEEIMNISSVLFLAVGILAGSPSPTFATYPSRAEGLRPSRRAIPGRDVVTQRAGDNQRPTQTGRVSSHSETYNLEELSQSCKDIEYNILHGIIVLSFSVLTETKFLLVVIGLWAQKRQRASRCSGCTIEG